MFHRKASPAMAVVFLIIMVFTTGCRQSENIDDSGKYIIDFAADKPKIKKINRQQAIITGLLLHQSDLTPTSIPYTLAINITGGPAQSNLIPFPPLAGRGPSRFANNHQPEVVTIEGRTQLLIRLLGASGASGEPVQGIGSTYHRDPTTEAKVSLTMGEDYILSNVRYRLTGIDMALSGDGCQAEPNNYACGQAFIDRIKVYSSSGRNVYQIADPKQVKYVGDIITASFTDTDNSGRPDGLESRQLAAGDGRGDVTIFHPTEIGSELSFSFGDAGKGIDGDPDGYHDFDAPEQSIGLASGISFNLTQLPAFDPPASETTTFSGIIYSDDNGNGARDSGEAGVGGISVALYRGDAVSQQVILATLSSEEVNSLGQFSLDPITAGETYRLEARLAMPSVPDGNQLNPLRLVRWVTAELDTDNQVEFGIWPFQLQHTIPETLDAETVQAMGLLLPDLEPLKQFPVPDEMPDSTREDVKSAYPGLDDWYLDTESQPGRVLMRFGTLALNRGEGPLHVVGGVVDEGQSPIYQRIYAPSGAFIEREAGEFIYHASHDHTHVQAFERYSLRELNTEVVLASSHKVSFCLTDVLWPIRAELNQAAPLGTVPMGWNCGKEEQSINVGFSDYYGPALPDQWIDVTEVPSGKYWLEVEVNPERHLLESDLSNNIVRIQVDYRNPQDE